MPASEPERLVEHFFRHEAGRLTAWLAQVLGFDRLDQAEDLVQDTLFQALQAWRQTGVPAQPSAWLYQAARHRALDALRREQRLQRLTPEVLRQAPASALPEQVVLPDELADSQLRMLFACCHPALAPEGQLALCLRVLGGLSVAEIAHAFLTSEDTITKRLYRAKQPVRAGRIALAVPQGAALASRLDAVLQALYLLFNAGYYAAHADQLIRQELCAEALRLALLLLDQPATAVPRTYALLALFCFQASRFAARTGPAGATVLLPEQDRSSWNQPLIARGFHYLARAATGEAASPYHLEAAIAAEHCRAATFAQTDWAAICRYYELLLARHPSPVVALHRAVAVAQAEGPAAGLTALAEVSGLTDSFLYHATWGELLARDKQPVAARDHFLEARLHTHSPAERELLDQKLRALGG